MLRKVLNWWFNRKVEVYLATVGISVLAFALVSLTIGTSSLFTAFCFFIFGIGIASFLLAAWR